MKDKLKYNEPKIDPIDIFLGHRLKDFRNKVGWTLSNLAEKLCVSHQQIHKYEQGVTKLSAGTIQKLALLFNTTPSSFYEGFNEQDYMPSQVNIDDILVTEKRKSFNILLIEDNPADEFLVAKILKDSEYEYNLFTLHNGEDVLNFLRNKIKMTPFRRPDIILLDLNLPNVSGHSLLRSLKHDREFQNIPVLIITNSLSKKDMETAYKNFASGYMSKSFDYKVFQKNLLTAISYWTETVILPT